MPSTDRRLELKEKTSMAQTAGQAFVYAKGLRVKNVSVRFNLSSHENRTVSVFACMGTAQCSQGHKHTASRV